MPTPNMERSISLDSSSTSTNYNNNNNNDNEHDNENMHNTYSTVKATTATAAPATTTQLRKALALRQNHQQQPQHQYHHHQPHHLQQQQHQLMEQHCNGSNENLSNPIATTHMAILPITAAMTVTTTASLNRQQPPHSHMKSVKGPLTHFLPKRKRQLQRQRPMEHSDDMDYAADLEEEDEDEEEDVNDVYVDDVEAHEAEARGVLGLTERIAGPHHYMPAKLHLAPAHQKRLQFQKYRQHSNLAMTPTTPNSPLFSGTTSVMSNCSPPVPLPAHSLAHHATRSSSTSSATSLDSHFKHQDSFESTVSLDTPQNRRQQFFSLKRDNSIQSDSSRYSSLECMLEARKPDPEAILINLGFGPVNSDDILSRIPTRFLKPSQVRGIDTDAFVKRLQLQLQLADHSVLGYRGLTGNPDMPPSSIVAKIMQRFEVNERKKSMGSLEHTI